MLRRFSQAVQSAGKEWVKWVGKRVHCSQFLGAQGEDGWIKCDGASPAACYMPHLGGSVGGFACTDVHSLIWLICIVWFIDYWSRIRKLKKIVDGKFFSCIFSDRPAADQWRCAAPRILRRALPRHRCVWAKPLFFILSLIFSLIFVAW